jgi:hypothetical protein
MNKIQRENKILHLNRNSCTKLHNLNSQICHQTQVLNWNKWERKRIFFSHSGIHIKYIFLV